MIGDAILAPNTTPLTTYPTITFIPSLLIPLKKQINTRLTNLFFQFKLNILPQGFKPSSNSDFRKSLNFLKFSTAA